MKEYQIAFTLSLYKLNYDHWIYQLPWKRCDSVYLKLEISKSFQFNTPLSYLLQRGTHKLEQTYSEKQCNRTCVVSSFTWRTLRENSARGRPYGIEHTEPGLLSWIRTFLSLFIAVTFLFWVPYSIMHHAACCLGQTSCADLPTVRVRGLSGIFASILSMCCGPALMY